MRAALARQYDTSGDLNIQVLHAGIKGNRTLYLEHHMHLGVPCHNQSKEHVPGHVEFLWGHDVVLGEIAA